MLWWWPGAAVIDRETAGEITALKRAGFGSAQIVDLEGYGDLSGPRSWQWGTPEWFSRFNAALAKANASHLRIDTAPYPIWMMTSPAVSRRPTATSPRRGSPTARVRSRGPTEFAGPPPDASTVAWQQDAGCGDSRATGRRRHDTRPGVGHRPHRLGAERRVGALVGSGGTLDAVRLLASSERPAAELALRAQPRRQPRCRGFPTPIRATADGGSVQPRCDPAALGWLDQNMMTPDAVNLFRADGGELYEDSLEYYYGTHSTPWTPKLLDEFRARRGYSLERYLPALFIPDLYTFWKSGATVYSKPDFDFAGGLGVRVRHDYYATLTDLFIEHQQLLQGWAQRYGLTGFRHQDYGTTIDSSRAQGATGIPDTESLTAGEPWPAGSPGEQQALDSYRVAAGAAHIAHAPAVNMETGDVQGCDKGFCPYGEQPTDYWRIINRAYTAGVTRIQIHGMAYRHIPPTEQGIQSNRWPGWNPWAGIFSEPWAEHGRSGSSGCRSRPTWAGPPRSSPRAAGRRLALLPGQLLGTAAGDWATRAVCRSTGRLHVRLHRPRHAGDPGHRRRGRLFADGAGYKALIVDAADSWVPGCPEPPRST